MYMYPLHQVQCSPYVEGMRARVFVYLIPAPCAHTMWRSVCMVHVHLTWRYRDSSCKLTTFHNLKLVPKRIYDARGLGSSGAQAQTQENVNEPSCPSRHLAVEKSLFRHWFSNMPSSPRKRKTDLDEGTSASSSDGGGARNRRPSEAVQGWWIPHAILFVAFLCVAGGMAVLLSQPGLRLFGKPMEEVRSPYDLDTPVVDGENGRDAKRSPDAKRKGESHPDPTKDKATKESNSKRIIDHQKDNNGERKATKEERRPPRGTDSGTKSESTATSRKNGQEEARPPKHVLGSRDITMQSGYTSEWKENRDGDR